MPYYSFVMLCHNNWKISKQALNTLLDSLTGKHILKGIEIIVVNNASTDNTAAGLKELKTNYASTPIEIRLVNTEKNMGYPVGVNLGLAKCRGEIITILNNDLIFSANWFDGLVNVLENNKDIGITVPYLSTGSGSQNVGVEFDSNSKIHDFAAEFMNNNQQEITYTQRVIGACLCVKRELINKIGGTDFWFGLGQFEDDDLSLRTMIAGYKLAVVGSSFVYHTGNVTLKQKKPQFSLPLSENRKKLLIKWNLKPLGDYSSKQNIIENNDYDYRKHYFPTKLNEFNSLTPPLIDKKQTENRLLLTADWNSDSSNWKKKLTSVLKNISQEVLYLWIPKKYFLIKKIKQEIKQTINSINFKQEITKNQNTPKRIQFYYANIYPVNLLRFLNSFTAVLTVKNDYINRYLTYLAKQISIPTD